MPKLVSKPLTDLAVRKAQPKDQRYDIYDAALRGFGVRVATSGDKTWFVMRRVKGQMVRHSLGKYPILSLIEARAAGTEALKKMSKGEHPGAMKYATFEAIFEEWFVRDQSKNRSASDVHQAMTNHVLPRFKNKQIDNVRKADILRMIDAVVDGGSPVQANRVLAYTRRLFNWCIERDLLSENPAAGIKAPSKEISRERVLTLDELRLVLDAARNIGYPWGPMLEMLIFTGQRLEEAANSTWDELDIEKRIWSLSGARTKNGRAHIVHLSDLMIATLEGLPRIDGQPWVFSTTGKGPIKGFSKAKVRIDKESGVTDWTFHDLRRTFATFTTDTLSISPVVVDKILNHASGVVKGVATVYQRGEYLDQRAKAMEAWATFLKSEQVSNSNVMPLRRPRQN